MKRLVLLIAVLAMVATPALASITTHVEGVQGATAPEGRDPVIYDNGLLYDGIAASQNDTAIGLDPILADDFVLTDPDTTVTDVHWIGGYWNGPPDDGNFDWEVTFYMDNFGVPGAVLYSELFANAATNETFIEGAPGASNYFSYDVTLTDSVVLAAGPTYWLSVQGQGNYAPQSGWAYHLDPILGSPAQFKSNYFGFPNWTRSFDVFGYDVDACFQLTGIPEPATLVLLTLGGLLLRRR